MFPFFSFLLSSIRLVFLAHVLSCIYMYESSVQHLYYKAGYKHCTCTLSVDKFRALQQIVKFTLITMQLQCTYKIVFCPLISAIKHERARQIVSQFPLIIIYGYTAVHEQVSYLVYLPRWQAWLCQEAS